MRHALLVCVCNLTLATAGFAEASPFKIATPRTDIYGDPLPPGALARIGTTRLRHAGAVSGLAYSADGKVLASASHDGTVCLWDAATGKLLRRFGDSTMFAVAITKDGKKVASAGSDGVALWDGATGKRLWRIDTTEMYCVAFSPDQTLIAAGGSDGKTYLCDIASGKVLRQLHDDSDNAEFKRLTSGRGRLTTSEQLALAFVSQVRIFAVAFAPDGKALATGGRHQAVRIWDVASGKKLAVLGEHDVKGLAFSPDGKLLAVARGDQAPVTLWTVANQTLAVQAPDPCQGDGVAFSHDGEYLAVCPPTTDRTIRVLETATGRVATKIETEEYPFAVMLAPDGKTLAFTGRGGLIHLRSLFTGKELLPEFGAAASIETLALSGNSKLVAASFPDGTVRLYDAAGRVLRVVQGTKASVAFLHLSPDGKRLLIGDAFNHYRLVDPATGKIVTALGNLPATSIGVRVSRDGRTLVFQARDGTIQVWDVVHGKEVASFPAPSDIRELVLSPDGTLLALRRFSISALREHIESSVEFWEVATGKRLRSVAVHWHDLSNLVFSPDGRSLAAISHSPNQHGIRLLETVTSNDRHWCSLPIGCDFSFFPEGRTLVLGDFFGQEYGELSSYIERCEPNLASQAVGGWITTWHLATGERELLFDGFGAVRALAIADDGKTLVSLSWDGTGLVWPVAERAKPAAVDLTAKELQSLWADLGGDNAAKAYKALWKLAAAPAQTVPFLKDQLRPVPPIQPKFVAQFRQALNSDKYKVRQQAMDDLRKLGMTAEPILRALLLDQPTLELRRRVELLLEPLESGDLSPERLRQWRALEVLEHIDDAAARKLVRALADGAPGAWLTRQAQAVEARWANK